ncbi:AlpA family transcriptional regulator [Anaeromyxobacter sp. SG66]|uniref:helix-turn-helix transcriptional regulator n=1 Tax=Anaeromyxobacter sp. SG66 TaxID=2925410 RepID=UPI001F55C4F1|nr:helix-turn-helix domain-containing protein [Anaeromyxobacter sp. SG66]
MSTDTKWMTIRDLMARFQLSRASVYALIARGALPRPTKILAAARWREEDIRAAEERFTTADRGGAA